MVRRLIKSKIIFSYNSVFHFPNLSLLCYHLDAANSNPSYAIDHLKDLAEDVDTILEHIELIDEYFAKNKSEEEIVIECDNFLRMT